mmetsp:Transcript_35582/g.94662  ORF Transcript_35582/g.94662 Transcript_35582/m.94662 type:complete len:389 (-) Transcript_35582:294-1460(-)
MRIYTPLSGCASTFKARFLPGQTHLPLTRDPAELSPAEIFKAHDNALYVGIGFIRIGNIDAVRGVFEASFQLRLAFCEPRLRGRRNLDTGQHLGGELEKCDRWLNWEDDCPNRPVVNSRSFANIKQLNRVDVYNVRLVHKIDGLRVDGLVRMTLFVRGVFHEYMDLRDFPYDTQRLSVHVRNIMGKPYFLMKWPRQTEYKFQCALTDFVFFSPPQIEFRKESGSANRLVFFAVVQRKSWFYELNVLIMLGIMITISFVTFVFKTRRELTHNLGIVLTLVLTAVTFRFSIADKLPPAAYSTVIDKYITVCFFALAFVVLAHLGASVHPSDHFERISFPLVACLWVLFNVVFCGRVFFFKRSARNKIVAQGLTHAEGSTGDRVVPWKILP